MIIPDTAFGLYSNHSYQVVLLIFLRPSHFVKVEDGTLGKERASEILNKEKPVAITRATKNTAGGRRGEKMQHLPLDVYLVVELVVAATGEDDDGDDGDDDDFSFTAIILFE